MMNDTPRVKRHPGAAWRKLDGRIMIVTPGDAMLHLLNEVGTFLWEQLDQPRDPRELAEAVCAAFDVDPDTAAGDVRDFVDEILGKAMLERC